VGKILDGWDRIKNKKMKKIKKKRSGEEWCTCGSVVEVGENINSIGRILNRALVEFCIWTSQTKAIFINGYLCMNLLLSSL
jgi:hypothetical protein